MDKQVINDNFSRSAESYDAYASVQKRCAEILIESLDGAQFDSLLEIGCGTGNYTDILRQKYPGSKITALDISETMVEVAKEKLSGHNVSFMLADAEDLRGVQEVDLITSNATLQWFSDLDASFKRFRKKLRDKGTIAVSIYGPDTFKEFKEVLNDHYGEREWLTSSKFPSKNDIEKILKKNFNEYKVSEVSFTVYRDSLLDFLKDIKRTGTRGEGLGKGFFLGKYALQDLERIYVEKYGRIKVTHNVHFCEATL